MSGSGEGGRKRLTAGDMIRFTVQDHSARRLFLTYLLIAVVQGLVIGVTDAPRWVSNVVIIVLVGVAVSVLVRKAASQAQGE